MATSKIVNSITKGADILRNLSEGIDRISDLSKNLQGFVAPVYTGSAGKILLSELKSNELQLLVENLQLNPIGPHTVTDKKTLLKELEKVRKQGYATSFGERIHGSASISVPIENYICPVALSVLGPDNRFSLNMMMNVLKEMKKSAIRISKKLIETNRRRDPQ
jgi:DNA-binding IclR family transcriptional regulator